MQRNLDIIDRAIAGLLSGSEGLGGEAAEYATAAIEAASRLREIVANEVHGEHEASVNVDLDLAGAIKPKGKA